ncbi:nuclear transport factor 2 family protein [bacterium]|nr:MAG: nuclear transport factor 2 family protein [bacterium]
MGRHRTHLEGAGWSAVGVSFYALLQRLLEAWHAGDADAAAALFAPDAVYREAGREPLQGRTAIRDFMRAFFQSGKAARMVVGDVLVDGDVAFVAFTFSVRGHAGAIAGPSEMGALVRFSGACVTEWREYRG